VVPREWHAFHPSEMPPQGIDAALKKNIGGWLITSDCAPRGHPMAQ